MKRGRRPGLSNNWSERKRRAAVVQRHRMAHGDVCPGWGVPSHAVDQRNPLCADHIVEVHQGGSERGELQPLCRRCNTRKSNAARNAARNPQAYSSREW